MQKSVQNRSNTRKRTDFGRGVHLRYGEAKIGEVDAVVDDFQRSLRIGIDARMYASHFTGIGRYVYELTQNLFKLDTHNEYILFMNEPEYSKFTPPNKRIQKILVNTRHYSFSEQTRFLKILWNAQLDLMHFTHFNAPILYKRPSIVTIHDLTLSFSPGKKMRSWLHRAAYHWTIRSSVKHAKKIIAVSHQTKKDLIHLLKTSSRKIEVIYEGVGHEFKKIHDPIAFKKTKSKYNIYEDFILYTGVWRTHKNLANLIKAFGRLIQEKNFKGQLVITGKQDPIYPEIKQTIQALNLEKNVILTGLVSETELIHLYNAAKLYVLPSLYEGFGLSPLEAMACGTPVVASNASCIPEICGKGNAIFFNPHDPDKIAETIKRVWNNKKLQKKLSERGLKRIKSFSWQKMARETLALYNKVT